MRATPPWALPPRLPLGGRAHAGGRTSATGQALPGASEAWMADAACRGTIHKPEDDLWFHPDGMGDITAAPREVLAKAVCWRCPVRDQCLSYALATHQQHGVWGGLTEGELRQLRRERRHTG